MRVEGTTQAIGVVVPHDMALDRELWRWIPGDVSLLFTRMAYMPGELTAAAVQRMGDPQMAARSATDLVTVAPDCLVYACTSGSFIGGSAGEKAITEAMTAATGVPALTTSGALITAATELGLERVAVANPYDDEISEAFRDYLGQHHVEVSSLHNLGLLHNIWQTGSLEVAELIRRTDTPDAQAIMVCCTNLVTYDIIADLEQELAKPVITANQATVWAALRLIGRDAAPGQCLTDSSSNRRDTRGVNHERG